MVMNMNKNILGNKLKLLIEEKEITQRQLATDLGIAVTTLSGYINNGHQPDFDTLSSLATYFDVTTDYLIGHNPKVENDRYSTDEVELVRIYRQLKSEQKDLLREQTKFYLKYNNQKQVKSSDTISDKKSS